MGRSQDKIRPSYFVPCFAFIFSLSNGLITFSTIVLLTLGIAQSSFNIIIPSKFLNYAQVGSSLQQVGGKAMS